MVMVKGNVKHFSPPRVEELDDEVMGHRQQVQVEPLNITAEELGSAFSDEVLIGWLRDGRLQVYSPIAVRFITDEHHVVAEAVEFNEFGFGQNSSEALADLQHAIAELYFTLEEEREHLGPDLKNVWEALQEHIRKNDHQQSPV